MTTIRDNYLMAAKGGKPYWVPSFTDDCNMFFPDYWFWEDPETGTDFFNIKWTANDAGRMPLEGCHGAYLPMARNGEIPRSVEAGLGGNDGKSEGHGIAG